MSSRAALTNILFVLRSDIPWKMLPLEMGGVSAITCWRRLRDADRIDMHQVLTTIACSFIYMRALLGGFEKDSLMFAVSSCRRKNTLLPFVSFFGTAAPGKGRRHDHETRVDHSLIRGLVTAGPVMRRGASSV